MPLMRRFSVWFVGLGLAVASSCAGCIEKLAPGQVAAGVTRLSMRNAAYVSKLVLADTKCGFENDAVKRAALVQGQPGSQGAVTWKVTNCTIDFPESTVISTDCVGTTAAAQGKITVTGTKRIRGTITGDGETPVIPAGADAVHMELEATFDNFIIRKSSSKAALTNVSGTLNYVFEPRIALSRSLGLCAVSTLDFSFSDVHYGQAKVIVKDGDHVFPVDVDGSNVVAQVGKWQDQENSFSGDLTVWGTKVTLPPDGDHEGLDDEYTPKDYLDSISCDPDLVLPVSYTCPSLKEQLVHGASRLTVQQLGAIASLADADNRCGFSSSTVLANVTKQGSDGSAGSATFTIGSPCTISFPSKTKIGTDCNGQSQFAQGSLTVIGTKKLTGVLTGDVNQPVAPNGRDPAELNLTVTFADFTLSNSSGENTFVTSSGTLSGTIRPRVAVDVRSGICSNTTSIAQFSNVSWRDAKLVVNSSGFDFQVNIEQATLNAQSGTNGDKTNYLAGTAVSDGLPITIPPAGTDPVLDPSYDEAKFVKSFSCAPGFELAQSDLSCSLNQALAANIARLTVQAAGTVTSMVQNDTLCGFSALKVQTDPSNVTGDNGEMGSMRWDIQHCRVGQPGVLSLGTDCAGTRTYSGGTADVTGTRVITGLRDTSLVIFASIIPKSRDAMTITLASVPLTDFAAWTVPAQDTDPYAKLTIHSGTLSATVSPGLGERKSKPGTFDVGTPVATFTDVELRNAAVTLAVAGKAFNLLIPALRVSALNGSLNGKSNQLSGAVTMGDNSIITIAPTVLDPEFNQTAFDNGYSCTSDLMATIPPQ